MKCSEPSQPPTGVETVHIEFQGADPSLGAKYGVDVKLDGTVVVTSKLPSLSISRIRLCIGCGVEIDNLNR